MITGKQALKPSICRHKCYESVFLKLNPLSNTAKVYLSNFGNICFVTFKYLYVSTFKVSHRIIFPLGLQNGTIWTEILLLLTVFQYLYPVTFFFQLSQGIMHTLQFYFNKIWRQLLSSKQNFAFLPFFILIIKKSEYSNNNTCKLSDEFWLNSQY